MTTQEFANHFATLIRSEKPNEAYETLYDPDAESIEASGDKLAWRELNEIKAKADWWNENHEIHDFEKGDPSIDGDQFVLTYTFDLTSKMTGKCIK